MYKFRDGNGGSNNAGGILPTKNDAGQIGGGLSYMVSTSTAWLVTTIRLPR